MILVDSNVLIDIITGDFHWSAWSVASIEEATRLDQLAINPIIYAEVSMGFKSPELTDAALLIDRFHRLELPYVAAFMAGKAFTQYKKNKGAKTSVLCDFYIGAHALVEKMPLLTRDVKIYKTYFPSLKLIHP